MNNKKKQLSKNIKQELDWINDIKDRDIRFRLKALDHAISLTYTYYIYHGYTLEELAKINRATEYRVKTWILIVAYIISGGMYDFGLGKTLNKDERDLLKQKYPSVNDAPICKNCIWADSRTGHIICFRKCKEYNKFQSR